VGFGIGEFIPLESEMVPVANGINSG